MNPNKGKSTRSADHYAHLKTQHISLSRPHTPLPLPTMSYVPLSTSFPMFDNWGPSKPRGYRDGCWPCRFRRKRCEPGLAGPEGPCEACSTFNMICCGRGIDRPPGHELATQLRALMTAWMRNTANRGPFVPPLDLTLVTLSVSPIVNSANYQHWDDTPIPLFPEVEAHNSHQGNTAGSAPSRNHEDTICWSYIIAVAMIVVTIF
ncbi:hypothetical protein BS47DRAFT_599408 [Hydnum rufescens UP504]|uniref:Zn(2)-C6 fungal-type domain-containing protein n=1 Tax=Hydnum rufescens UP504 TaxID=1448309 RepID=A0A9P6AGN0_9AGAM|nr:hypothetical protein BS47DRAFT_599408 [Hydnum rufescens UP504]